MKRIILGVVVALWALCMLPAVSYGVALGKGDLTIAMKYGNTSLTGLNIAIYQVADITETGGKLEYTLTSAFSGSKVTFNDLSTEANIAISAKLDTYASANQIPMTANKVTDNSGNAEFTGLNAGLYLVTYADRSKEAYVITPFLVSIPTQNADGKSWNYILTAYPKAEPTPGPTPTELVTIPTETVPLAKPTTTPEVITMPTENVPKAPPTKLPITGLPTEWLIGAGAIVVLGIGLITFGIFKSKKKDNESE